jgi:hypothetical protein
VVASLHQAIAETLPLRLEFYENWLKPLGLLREGRPIGAASFSAALSFLRLEEPPSIYRTVTRRAGELAAAWTFAAQPWTRRRLVRWVPARTRLRAALRLARAVARSAYPGSRVRFRVDPGSLEVRGSIFCQVREQASAPLCGFYAGVVERLLIEYGLSGDASLGQCRAAGAQSCRIDFTWRPQIRAARQRDGLQ